ncbi:MAG: alkaline ceramidase [Pelagibacterium sp. SCN 63-23]|nr:MAG: alkaline ceramidase [Pelagibacterium sp. SCN 63-23]
MIRAGAASIDITPPPGLAMAGFVARSAPASGAHDPLTARAIAVNDTALVVADVIGIDAAMSARIRQRCCLPDANVIVAATHTHGGPLSMASRLSGAADPAFLRQLEDGCVRAIDAAIANSVPARLSVGLGADPDIARNRRHPQGITDRTLPLLRIHAETGELLALLVGYACHPVVLAADNNLWTADYPHFVRAALERSHPGAIAIFATGCVGDVNTGHSAQASVTLAANPQRSFAAAERIGTAIARAALAAPQQDLVGPVAALERHVELALARSESEPLPLLAKSWRAEATQADPIRRTLLTCWADWAEQADQAPLSPLPARVSLLDWGGLPIIGMPGEVFASTGLVVRHHCPGPAFVLGFADDNPGYIPPGEEYGFGGYEVEEAHRYYGLPAAFAAGSAETLANAAIALLDAMKAKQAQR